MAYLYILCTFDLPLHSIANFHKENARFALTNGPQKPIFNRYEYGRIMPDTHHKEETING